MAANDFGKAYHLLKQHMPAVDLFFISSWAKNIFSSILFFASMARILISVYCGIAPSVRTLGITTREELTRITHVIP